MAEITLLLLFQECLYNINILSELFCHFKYSGSLRPNDINIRYKNRYFKIKKQCSKCSAMFHHTGTGKPMILIQLHQCSKSSGQNDAIRGIFFSDCKMLFFSFIFLVITPPIFLGTLEHWREIAVFCCISLAYLFHFFGTLRNIAEQKRRSFDRLSLSRYPIIHRPGSPIHYLVVV